MNPDKLYEMFEKTNCYLKFDEIPVECRLHPDDFICGLMKLHELLNKKNLSFCAEHDAVYLSSAYDLTDNITQEDVDYLKRCGFHYDSGNQCVCAFC